MYTLGEIVELRAKIWRLSDVDYCNVLADEVYQIVRPNQTKNERLLKEEWEDSPQNEFYPEYVTKEIEAELKTKGTAFAQLANSTGEDKTFVHEFVLFSTPDGVVRLESYGKDEILRYENGKVNAYPGYSLYCARILEWPTWQTDLLTLLESPPGTKRLAYWNGLFSAVEEADTKEDIDVILYTKEEY